jgi:glycosyltransferase involved in cell wall biosynthesis
MRKIPHSLNASSLHARSDQGGEKMKVVVMNTTDIQGGAARCAHRLHNGLRQAGVDSTYFVQKKLSTDEHVMTSRAWAHRLFADLRPGIDRMPMRLYRHRQRGPFSTGLMSPFDMTPVLTLEPDVVNLHYVGEGFLPVRSLTKIGKPIVWTLHDSQPFTGGCHLPGDCKAYEQSCGNCPMLGSTAANDLSRWILRHKANQWRDLNITIVTDSSWLADCARKSSLFGSRRIEPINPGLNLKAYSPIDRGIARSILSLPQDKKLILFGAMHSTSDPNKGFQLLLPAVQHLSKMAFGADTEVVVFGASRSLSTPDFGMPSHYLGRLHDDISLAVLYSAADVMVVPSIRESFGQTASEAMACGTPVVAFAATGLLDIVKHQHNGYLAKPYDSMELARGIAWVLSRDLGESSALSENARKTAIARFSIESMTARYVDLFKDVLGPSRGH